MTTTQYVQQLGVRCYSPLQYRVAYNLNELYRDRITGAGRTIVVVDSFGSPTVQHDLDVFDAMWGLPATEVGIVRVNWPASDPLVIAVGGTRLDLDDSGARLGPDAVWNDRGGAGGGGLSSVFGRPAFQDTVESAVGDQRGLPDISASAAHDGGAWVYTSYDAAHTGWRIFGGTGEATPLFAAVIALADQAAGHRVANIDESLYRLAATHCATDSGIVDITNGDNNYQTVTGYSAAPGCDLASGLGTFDTAALVRALAHQSDLSR